MRGYWVLTANVRMPLHCVFCQSNVGGNVEHETCTATSVIVPSNSPRGARKYTRKKKRKDRKIILTQKIPPHNLCFQTPLTLPPPTLPRLPMRQKPLFKAQPTLTKPPHTTPIPPPHNPHQLRRHRAVVVRNPQRVARHAPLLAKHAKVYQADARPLAGRCEHTVRGGVELVRVGCQVAKVGEVVFVGRVAAVPGEDVKGGVGLGVGVEFARELGEDLPVFVHPGTAAFIAAVDTIPSSRRRELHTRVERIQKRHRGGAARYILGLIIKVQFKARNRVLEIPHVRQRIRAQRAQLRQLELRAKDLQDVAHCSRGIAGRKTGQGHGKSDTGGDDGDGTRWDTQVAELGLQVEGAALGHEEKGAVVVDEGLAGHVCVEGVLVDGKAFF